MALIDRNNVIATLTQLVQRTQEQLEALSQPPSASTQVQQQDVPREEQTEARLQDAIEQVERLRAQLLGGTTFGASISRPLPAPARAPVFTDGFGDERPTAFDDAEPASDLIPDNFDDLSGRIAPDPDVIGARFADALGFAPESRQLLPKPEVRLSERELLAALPPEERAAFMSLPKAERSFLLTLEDKFQGDYAAMSPMEQEVFRSIPAPMRERFLSLRPVEREAMETMDPTQQARFLAAPERDRSVFEPSPVGSAMPAEVPEIALGESPVEASAEHLMELFDAPATPELHERASVTVANALYSKPWDPAGAIADAAKVLLSTPAFAEPLMQQVESSLGGDQMAQAKLMRAALPQLAASLIKPGVTRLELIAGLREQIASGARATSRRRDDSDTLARPLFGLTEGLFAI